MPIPERSWPPGPTTRPEPELARPELARPELARREPEPARPELAPPEPERSPAGPARPAVSPPLIRSHSADDASFAVAATIAGTDGTTLLSVSRHTMATEGGSAVLVTAAGVVDMETAPLLQTALLEAVQRHQKVCCDLASVTFFSAAGATALVNAHVTAQRSGCRFSVRGATGIVRQVLEITELHHLTGGR